ncbi:MAG: AMP-binding protein [Synergistaceae bacterium]|nr:AMP-binding protein [Synergistaceae bacterium]MBQ3760035.1 AMP-binding protein [Synergistaceae bacterium]MBQ6115341.1 AMP-binding protein [Synergistaceae bacterium]MBR0185242.1 AMP-binding protein [Synergistaceae bacterium]MBR0247535.1 AMP-binding protein [Synergistaceae bacterium]
MLNKIMDEYLASKPDAKCCWFNHEWISRKDFARLADECTEILRASGFTEGQRLAVLMPNSPMTLAIILATWRLGGVFCPLNEKTGEISLLKTLGLLKPFAVILSESVNEKLESALKGASWPCARFGNEKISGNEKFTGKTQPADDFDKTLAVIFSTSGTTGDPKAVPLTHSNILDNINACLEHVPDLQPEDSLLNVLPNFHAFGFTICCILPFVLKATQVIVTGFMPPSNVIKAIEETHPTVLLLVPTMLGFAASLLERQGKKLSGIKLLIAGGDRYNPKMDDRVTAAFGVPVIEGYGITECSPVLAVNPKPSVRKLGTVGPALPRFELQLRSEAGELLEIPGEGVLWCKGPSVTSGYYHAPEINKERFVDGWFNTGDYVKIGEDGYIKILDRVTDIIIVGGFNVYPQEVEAILSEHPAVNMAVVVGMPNDISGEVPKAYIVKTQGAEVTESELVKFCKERLSHYKVPRSIEFVDSLPISSTGKILRRVLRQKEREKN